MTPAICFCNAANELMIAMSKEPGNRWAGYEAAKSSLKKFAWTAPDLSKLLESMEIIAEYQEKQADKV